MTNPTKRGRKSGAELASLGVVGVIEAAPAFPAPDSLTDAEAAIWRQVVSGLPREYFGVETWGLLSAYCRHAAAAEVLQVEIERYEPNWLKDAEGLTRYGKLLAFRERETRAMNALARSLRLTNQSRYRPAAAGRAGPPMQKPWL